MEKVIFKRAALSAAVVAALVAPGMALAAQDMMSPTYGKSYEAFADDAKLSGGLFYFQRDRTRIDSGVGGAANNTGKYTSNLSHATAQAALNFNSGYAWDVVGLDLGGYAAYDLAIDESNPVNAENEFSFWGRAWGTSNTESENGASLTNAALKLKLIEGVTAKAGYTQLYVPGQIGVNWSYQPGTYRGGQVEGNVGGLYLTYAIADEYKAPWFKETQGFYKSKAWGGAWGNTFDKENEIDYIHAVAARYTFDNGTAITGSFGQSADYMDSYHVKLAHKFDVMGGLSTSYQFYGSETETYKNASGRDVETYDGLAWQQALTAAWNYAQYGFRLEGMWTKAEGAEGNYLPRLTRGYGNSQGANEIWWDSRSDWNANNEKALFFGVTRSLDDLVGAPGWSVGVSGAYGWDMERGDGTKAANGEDTEWAANFDVSYTVQDGKLKGTLFKLHYTDYNNDLPSDWSGWTEYPNVFTSERDVKFHIIMPFTFM
ncbi:OprD family outer membrane porin [Aeromonas sobria]|uniref:OprD family outer membrane porin n=1 Tax=Aeromonas sobria TaxID=646 RepID=UPI000C6DA572|nr:OprD family outer membrane porin [Aeromonas sobria]PKQ72684.1 outer membrane porin, OprD family [Aeromonas sobria]